MKVPRFTGLMTALIALALAYPAGQTLPAFPLVQVGEFVKVGYFDIDGAGYDAVGPAAYHSANNSLYMLGWDEAANTYAGYEVAIPATLNLVVPKILQPLKDPFEGKRGGIGVSDSRIGGQFVANGKLILSVYAYYDAASIQTRSHFMRPLDLSAAGQVVGPVQVSAARNAGYYSGYMAQVPQAWRAVLGESAVTGNCCIPILSRTSFGPALFAFDPITMKATADLVWYDGAHPLAPYGQTGVASPIFNGSTTVSSVIIPEGTNSALFFGRTGIGPYCYGDGAECNDPESPHKGEHAYPYVSYMWAYDLADFAAVKAGRREPWSLRPYWHGQAPTTLDYAAYDGTRGLFYFIRRGGASNGLNPRVEVYRTRAGKAWQRYILRDWRPD